MSKSTPRLGKGLNALIGTRTAAPFHHRATHPTEPLIPASPEDPRLRQIPVERLHPNPNQPRASLDQAGLDRLAESIRQTGILQPVLVRTLGGGDFELVAGERRWRAAKLAGLQTIPALVRELSDAESFQLALIENIQREDLGPLERATAYQQLIDIHGVPIDALATRLSESRANIANYLRLLKLSKDVQELISAGQLGMGQARAIAAITNPQQQLSLARLAVRRNLSVRQVEALGKVPVDAGTVTRPAPPQRASNISDVEETLSKALGLVVRLQPGRKKNSGRVIIRYSSLEEFDRIAEKIVGRPLME
jgi:ParB family chromosome partitioning protein